MCDFQLLVKTHTDLPDNIYQHTQRKKINSMEKNFFGPYFSIKPDEEGEGEVSFFLTVSITYKGV